MSNAGIKISVLITIYNGERYLRESIYSVLIQTYQDFELVIVDDGSIDNTESIIKSIEDKRIRYIKIEHCGRSKALNYGLEKCASDWVALMDADDIWDPDKLAEQVTSFSFNYNAISCTWSAYFSDGKIRFTVDTPVDIIELQEKFLLHSYICNPSVIYNRKFILEHGGYDESLSLFEDYDLWLRVLNYSRFEVISKYFVFVRYNRNSESYRGLKYNKEIVMSIQNKYFQVGRDICGITKSIENELSGWREYFYGERNKARNYWSSMIKTLLDWRILSAYLITFFPRKWISIIKRMQIRYRLRLLFSPRTSGLNKKFNNVITEISKISMNHRLVR